MIEPVLAALRLAERGCLAALMIAMSALYTFNVAVRFLVPSLSFAFAWIDEATLFALAWSVFLGLGLALERGRHIALTRLLDGLARGPRRRLIALINLTGLLFSLYIAKLGLDITLFVLASGQTSPTLNVSMAWLYAAVPIGFALLGLRYLLALVGRGDRFALEHR
ncbi:MAG: TRAP transporter small permease [Pseudomonadota bacterium]